MIQTLLRTAALGAVFLLTFAGACTGLRALLPERQIPEVTAKLQHFRQHAAEYDTLFIGSSRIYHQLIPELFDRTTAAHGLPTRTFNAGIDAIQLRTDQPYTFTLAKFFETRERRRLRG